jgi:hypothetical protein
MEMTMNHKERASSLRPRPYGIVYLKGNRRLRDSAETLDGAKARAHARLSKPHNRGETVEVYFGGELVWLSMPRATA